MQSLLSECCLVPEAFNSKVTPSISGKFELRAPWTSDVMGPWLLDGKDRTISSQFPLLLPCQSNPHWVVMIDAAFISGKVEFLATGPSHCLRIWVVDGEDATMSLWFPSSKRCLPIWLSISHWVVLNSAPFISGKFELLRAGPSHCLQTCIVDGEDTSLSPRSPPSTWCLSTWLSITHCTVLVDVPFISDKVDLLATGPSHCLRTWVVAGDDTAMSPRSPQSTWCMSPWLFSFHRVGLIGVSFTSCGAPCNRSIMLLENLGSRQRGHNDIPMIRTIYLTSLNLHLTSVDADLCPIYIRQNWSPCNRAITLLGNMGLGTWSMRYCQYTVIRWSTDVSHFRTIFLGQWGENMVHIELFSPRFVCWYLSHVHWYCKTNKKDIDWSNTFRPLDKYWHFCIENSIPLLCCSFWKPASCMTTQKNGYLDNAEICPF